MSQASVAPRDFVDSICRALAGVFARTLDGSWTFDLARQAPLDDSPRLWFMLSEESESSAPSSVLAMPRSHAGWLISKIMGLPAEEVTLDQEQISVIQELIQEALTAAFLDPKVGLKKPSTRFVRAAPGEWAPAETIRLEGSDGSSGEVHFQLQIGSELSAMLARMKRGIPQPASGPGRAGNENLDMVMDVELNITLRFGRREMQLRDIMELTSGSIIELDRQAQEPVELLLGDRVIARGEVVIVDGNYGLRVTEVTHPESAD